MILKKAPPWHVLVFPAASEIAFEIARALGACKEVILYGAQQPGDSMAPFHFARLLTLSPISDLDCLPKLQRLIAEHHIDAIFPAHDDVLVWLSAHEVDLKAAVITSDAETNRICRSKSATYRRLQGVVPVPHLFAPGAEDLSFPVFVKPDAGQGSQRARLVDNRHDLVSALLHEPDLLVMEYLPGLEFTVDCFSQAGRVLYARARQRVVTRNGIATLTRSVNLDFVEAWAERIITNLDLRGGWFFQIKQNAVGDFVVLEVAPRVAGSMALHRVNGPNFPLLSLFEAADHPVTIDVLQDDKMVMGRSLDLRFIGTSPIGALYIDLDDTLILRGQVNTLLMALIFQCRNRAIPVHLITRHKQAIDATLAHYRLTGLFDRVIHLTDAHAPKVEAMREPNAMLIDDSFRERHAVIKQGFRAYDAAGAVCLIDERV